MTITQNMNPERLRGIFLVKRSLLGSRLMDLEDDQAVAVSIVVTARPS